MIDNHATILYSEKFRVKFTQPFFMINESADFQLEQLKAASSPACEDDLLTVRYPKENS